MFTVRQFLDLNRPTQSVSTIVVTERSARYRIRNLPKTEGQGAGAAVSRAPVRCRYVCTSTMALSRTLWWFRDRRLRFERCCMVELDFRLAML